MSLGRAPHAQEAGLGPGYDVPSVHQCAVERLSRGVALERLWCVEFLLSLQFLYCCNFTFYRFYVVKQVYASCSLLGVET